ncbi:MAG: retropepsin-like aspartic protease [Candidatus Omnitrophica bacterium]|jgi:clan AA aspartic protease (TIGR02281 family)|nr:retropepsin-like aspartic protease [Candidatus Omnitrophota bacterium]MDD5027584.1 retropepsin-like aspartic protease [Candidatus Omnitrophota bacterium]
MMRVLSGLFLILVLVSLAYADRVYLKNGRSLEGIVKSDNGEAVELEVGVTSSVTFLKSGIEKIVKTSAADSVLLRQEWEKHKRAVEKKIAELQTKEEKKPAEVTFSRNPGGIAVSVMLEDKVSARMVLDTGASLVIITQDIAGKLGIDLSGAQPDLKVQVADGRQVNARRLVIQTMEVQGARADKVEAAVLLGDAGNLGFGDGLLGMSFLKRFNFEVDQKEKKLTLEKL